jgi:hypothetical protein
MQRKSAQGGAERRLRRQVEKLIGRVEESQWGFLRKVGCLETAVGEEEREPGEGVRYLAEIIEPLRLCTPVAARGASAKKRKRRLSASERLVAALRRLQARAAAQFPEVNAWRREWLPNGLLAPEQVKAFMLRPQRRFAVWTMKAAVQGEPPKQPPAGAEVVEQRLAWEPQESLDKLAARLADRFGWSRAAAAVWLVTGVLPDEPAVLIERVTSFPGDTGVAMGLPPVSLLRLVVPLFATPSMVADRLRRIRSARGTRLRSLGARTAALLEHVAEHGDGRDSWREWRRRYGGYPQFKQFRQAIKRAVLVLHRAVVGEFFGSIRAASAARRG